MKSRLNFEPVDHVLDPCHLFEWAVKKDHIAILVLHLAHDAIDSIASGVKIIEAQLIPANKIDHDTNADANGKPKHMDQRIPPLPEDIAPGHFQRDGICRHRKGFCKSIIRQFYARPTTILIINQIQTPSVGVTRPVTIQPLSA